MSFWDRGMVEESLGGLHGEVMSGSKNRHVGAVELAWGWISCVGWDTRGGGQVGEGVGA